MGMIASVGGRSGEDAKSRVAQRPASVRRRDTLDDGLIERIAAGGASSMKVLYTRHNLRIYRFILRIVGNEAVAEELTHEVFLDVWKNASKFEGRSEVSTWLLAVARHEALGMLRRKSAQPLHPDEASLTEDLSENAEQTADRSKTNAILAICLTRLSPAHREVVDLVYYHGRTVQDAALIVNAAPNTVKTRLFYARKHLAELLCAYGIVTSFA
jgi:RNA polymerase sigma-70 factor (ECF subfamily)